MFVSLSVCLSECIYVFMYVCLYIFIYSNLKNVLQLVEIWKSNYYSSLLLFYLVCVHLDVCMSYDMNVICADDCVLWLWFTVKFEDGV